MKTQVRNLAVALAALLLVAGSAQANGRGWHGPRGHFGPGYGLFWGTVGLGVGLGVARGYYDDPYYVYPYPGYVLAPPPAYYHDDGTRAERREPLAKAPPDPIFYPRNGQSAAQTETDRRECNRWATTQPSAMADASIFHRATMACMDAHGYTSR